MFVKQVKTYFKVLGLKIIQFTKVQEEYLVYNICLNRVLGTMITVLNSFQVSEKDLQSDF